MKDNEIKRRSLCNDKTKPRNENKGYDPLMTKSSFEIVNDAVYEQTYYYDYAERKKKIVPITIKRYGMRPFFLCSNDLFSICTELSKPAMKVLNYIINRITMNSNFIELKAKPIMENTKIKSLPTIYSAIKELCDNDIIHKAPEKNNSTYDININLFFKGRRNDFIDRYIEMRADDVIDGGCIVAVGEAYEID